MRDDVQMMAELNLDIMLGECMKDWLPFNDTVIVNFVTGTTIELLVDKNGSHYYRLQFQGNEELQFDFYEQRRYSYGIMKKRYDFVMKYHDKHKED